MQESGWAGQESSQEDWGRGLPHREKRKINLIFRVISVGEILGKYNKHAYYDKNQYDNNYVREYDEYLCIMASQ
jgi:hypothetical protein